MRLYQRNAAVIIERSGNASQNCWFIKCMQKLEKSIVQYFVIWILCHKQQDPGKSWKNTFFNTFLIKILKEKNSHKHQDPKTGKSKISILFWWENTPRSWQKLENQNFNTFLFKTLIGRSSHKHQDPGKSWKNQNFNTFLIRILIEKSSRKHQDPAKSWKNQNFNTILMRKNTKILAKAGKNKIAILFI